MEDETSGHPGRDYIVKTISIIEEKDIVFILMEHLNGGELFNVITGQRGCKKRIFSEAETAELAFQVASALDYVHKNGIMYRDLKTENLVFADETQTKLKLVDFGLAIQETHTTGYVGTCGYLAPEVINCQRYNNKVDTWTMGVVIYEILMGCPPFGYEDKHVTSDEPVKFPEDNVRSQTISEECKAFIKKLLKKNPAERPDINDVIASLTPSQKPGQCFREYLNALLKDNDLTLDYEYDENKEEEHTKYMKVLTEARDTFRRRPNKLKRNPWILKGKQSYLARAFISKTGLDRTGGSDNSGEASPKYEKVTGTSPGGKPYTFWVPKAQESKLQANQGQIDRTIRASLERNTDPASRPRRQPPIGGDPDEKRQPTPEPEVQCQTGE